MKTALIIAFVALPACDGNRSGDIRATRLGDLSHALAARVEDERAAGCDVRVEAGTVLQRRPYLQRLTDSSLRVAWTTDARAADGAVVVERSGGDLVTVAAAEREGRASKTIAWNAAISGLEPNTGYCYAVESGRVTLGRGSFRTAPQAGSGQAVRFIAFGDSGTGSADQQAVRDQMKAVPIDLMIHLGDIAYGSGTRAQLESYFFRVYADLLRDVAVFPASGNHEYETEDAAPFREAFLLPENGGSDGFERWYSYDFGDVHFVVLDTERVGPSQVAWLDADLVANHLPWTIVYFHRPPYSSGEHGSDANVQRSFVPLLVKHHVPLVLSGHDHHYERSKPLSGVTYIVSGGGGRGTRPVGASAFTAFSEAVCHFLYVVVAGDELTLHAIDGVGQEFDSLALTRHVP
jgi:hypothetical protein